MPIERGPYEVPDIFLDASSSVDRGLPCSHLRLWLLVARLALGGFAWPHLRTHGPGLKQCDPLLDVCPTWTDGRHRLLSAQTIYYKNWGLGLVVIGGVVAAGF